MADLDRILESLHSVGPGSDWVMVNERALNALIAFARSRASQGVRS